MVITFRVAIAIALVFGLFLVKNHLDSIDSQWLSDRDASLGPDSSDYVLDDAGAHFELVSRKIALSSSSSSLPTPSLSSPTSKQFLEPTKPPATPTKFEPKRIPVNVPNQYLDFLDPSLDKYFNDLDLSIGLKQGRKKMPKPSSPPKPKVTPKTDRIIVLGRMSWEDADWLEEELPE